MSQSQGISSNGTKFQIESGVGTAKTITAITKANPGVVTATAHGLATGDVVNLAAIGGMTELNGLFALIKVLTANTFELSEIDTTSFTTYTSGGTATPVTFTDACEVRNFNPSDPGTPDIPKSTICSDAVEVVGGLPDNGTATIDFNYVYADVALTAMWAARRSGAEKIFRFKFPFTVPVWAACKAVVRRLPELPTFGVNTMLQGQGEIRISGKVYRTSGT